MSLPIAALPVIKELITAAANYQMCKEHETTERLKLEAQLEACLTAINANQANFFRAMEDNREVINRAYDAAEKMMLNPKIFDNPTLFQSVMMFLQNAHATHSLNFANAVNAHPAARLPRIG